ncbi:MAG: DMT family transporter [Chloroflexota bacterium]
MNQKNYFIGIFSGLSAAAIWGGMYVVSKVVLEVIPPFSLLLLRLILGFAALLTIIMIRGGFSVKKEQFWSYFGVGVIGYGISLGFQFVGTKLSTAANGSLVTSATPALVIPFALILLNEKITRKRLAAILLASIGVIAVIDPRNAEMTSKLFLGNISLLCAAITWALYSVLVRKVSYNTDILQASAIMLLGGLPITIPASIWELTSSSIGRITIPIIGGILFLGFISTAIAMFLWNYAFAKLPASVASLTFFAQPLVGSLLGWYFLSEKITPLFMAGGVLIGIGILISSRD